MSDVIAYAWRKEGMVGWALGHNPPTPNMADFDKYEVRQLIFKPDNAEQPILTAHLIPGEGVGQVQGTLSVPAGIVPGSYVLVPETVDAVIVDRVDYDSMIHDSIKLDALECAGVDNWEGYDEAMEMVRRGHAD